MNYTFTRTGIGTALSDPQKSFMWCLRIPEDAVARIVKKSISSSPKPLSNVFPNVQIPSQLNVNNLLDKFISEEDLLIKCRTASIPAKVFQDIKTSFYGQKRSFPSKVEFSNSFTAEFEEVERQSIKKFFDAWQGLAYSSNFRSDMNAGNSNAKDFEYFTNITVSMIGYNGIPLDKSVTFYNCWVKEVQEVPLNYTASDIIKYSVVFSFDYWELTQEPLIDIPRPF